MDYRDSNGYFQEDVLRLLGRSGTTLSTSGAFIETPALPTTAQPLTYRSIRSGNFVEANDTLSETNSEDIGYTEDESDASVASSFDMESEWEEVKQVLYTTFIGMLMPVVFRYVGRRLTFSLWTSFLKSYFKSH
ncbi:hypothetical protein LPJ66_004728 [Kickxella alabastrina]|uniref:Uncharacterized protein n=1 Tax=Kickxella alabastrina TaxID=61397 RepID=A0ACC1IG78_9FUNG|nr:hypothetical protein LPJ66_004728 [Kickxella alabastrina]